MALTQAEINRYKKRFAAQQAKADRDADEFAGRNERAKRDSLLKAAGITSEKEAAMYTDDALKKSIRTKAKKGRTQI